MMNKEQLDILITRYFDGETTVDEERELRRELTTTRWQSPLIDEARAVTGYFAACGTKLGRRKPRVAVWQQVAAAAVVTAMTVSIAVGLGSRDVVLDSDCIAYVGGTTVTDGAAVHALVSEQLALIGMAAETVENDVIDDLRNVFDLSVDAIN